MNKLKKILQVAIGEEIYGFISPSVELNNIQSEYKNLIGQPDYKEVESYEKSLSEYLGGGLVISFASGRMSFYALLKCWNIGEGDEVALTGFTCSVMVNAVLKTGAKPLFIDIDKDTLGMSPESLRERVGKKTKVVVAQHSFGIPCEIDTIYDIARENGSYLIEDCAITLGSSYKGKTCGNWGDASIFSTDHTKPLNTLIGGFVYTNDSIIAQRVREIQCQCGELTQIHQQVILKQYLKEHEMEVRRHNNFILNNYWRAIRRRLHLQLDKLSPYLEYEASTKLDESPNYPYPAKMPSVLAKIGQETLNMYKNTVDVRKRRLTELLATASTKSGLYIPKSYYDTERIIIPLRFVFMTNETDEYSYIDDWVWFKQPIVATIEPMENFGYKAGMCPVAEETGRSIMNFPILLAEGKHSKMLERIKEIYL